MRLRQFGFEVVSFSFVRPGMLFDFSPQGSTKDKKPDPPIPQAHFTEFHWVNLRSPWAQAAQGLVSLFPRDTRPDRPREWYSCLWGTHWPGCIPPGNGPFYLPEWAFSEDELARMVPILKSAGYKQVVAHVLFLPQNNEQLVAAMRAAGKHPWTADPIRSRAYIYPKLRNTPDKQLREFNVDRWCSRR